MVCEEFCDCNVCSRCTCYGDLIDFLHESVKYDMLADGRIETEHNRLVFNNDFPICKNVFECILCTGNIIDLENDQILVYAYSLYQKQFECYTSLKYQLYHLHNDFFTKKRTEYSSNYDTLLNTSDLRIELCDHLRSSLDLNLIKNVLSSKIIALIGYEIMSNAGSKSTNRLCNHEDKVLCALSSLGVGYRFDAPIYTDSFREDPSEPLVLLDLHKKFTSEIECKHSLTVSLAMTFHGNRFAYLTDREIVQCMLYMNRIYKQSGSTCSDIDTRLDIIDIPDAYINAEDELCELSSRKCYRLVRELCNRFDILFLNTNYETLF